jgi:PPOX class probable F420-dependent enzyme
MSESDLAQFAGQWYVNLETYRRNGEAVRTPLWFVEDQGTLYMRTAAYTAKVPAPPPTRRGVRVVPSARNGTPRGTWLAREAHLLPADTPEARGSTGWCGASTAC